MDDPDFFFIYFKFAPSERVIYDNFQARKNRFLNLSKDVLVLLEDVSDIVLSLECSLFRIFSVVKLD